LQRKNIECPQLDESPEQIVALQTALGAPHDVMMFSAATSNPIQQDIYIGLPDLIWLQIFPGLTRSIGQACLIFLLLWCYMKTDSSGVPRTFSRSLATLDELKNLTPSLTGL
jgi:hypothetical protein